MRGVPAAGLGVPEERREVDHPQDVVTARGDELEAAGELEAQRAEHRRRGALGVGDDQQQVAAAGLQTRSDLLDLLRR